MFARLIPPSPQADVLDIYGSAFLIIFLSCSSSVVPLVKREAGRAWQLLPLQPFVL